MNNRLENENLAVKCMKLTFDRDLGLSLYRHWSLFESLRHTIYTASKFKIWTLKGQQKLSEYLAELGLPLVQCKQMYSTMDLTLRNDICDIFMSKAKKYGIEDEITKGTFSANFGYRHKFCAEDIVRVVIALMEEKAKGPSDFEDKFLSALDSLSRDHISLVNKGIDLAKQELQIIFEQVQNFFDLNHAIVSAGPFLYAVIQNGAPNAKHFGRPTCLQMLAQHTLKGYVSVSSKSKKVKRIQ